MTDTKKLLLHIGQHKTGTSSIQKFFDAAGDKLAAHGIIYPKAGRNGVLGDAPGHHALARAFYDRHHRGELPEVAAMVASVRKEFELSGGHTLVISAEDIYACPRPQVVFDYFPDFDTEIYVSLRPQHEMIGAMYYTAATGEKFDIPPETYYEQRLLRYCDYRTRMDLWREAFPDALFHSRLYDQGQAVRKDAVADIVDAFRLPVSQADVPPLNREHPTLPAKGLQLLRAAVRFGFTPKEYYLMFLVLHMERDLLGKEMSAFPPSFRAGIHEKYREGNAEVRRRFFDGADGDLFSEPQLGNDDDWYDAVGDIDKVVRQYLMGQVRKKLTSTN